MEYDEDEEDIEPFKIRANSFYYNIVSQIIYARKCIMRLL